MSSQGVFWINVGIGIAFWVIFKIRRGNREPTRLNLRAGNQAPPDSKALVPAGARAAGPSRARRPAVELMSEETLIAQGLSSNEKVLNVLFNYNGHTWDAFEILGVPAGSSLQVCESAYKSAATKSSPEAMDFLASAYQAIRSRSLQGRGA